MCTLQISTVRPYIKLALTLIVNDIYTGLIFVSEPSNVTVGVGQEAHFSCSYYGTHASPLWNIIHPGGTSKTVSTARLPLKHSSNATGLTVVDVEDSHNMTSYSCLFQIYNRNRIELITSTIGTLIVLETITFSLRLSSHTQLPNNQTLNLFKGDSPPLLTIVKSGYSADTFVVVLRIKGFHSDRNSKNNTLL